MLVPFPTADPEQKRLGDRVRRLREARGLSRDRLASEIGLGPDALARAEQGRRRLASDELHRVTLALHVPMRLLFEPAVDLSRLRRL
jgi:transcriptional regulator with XRE-family HTH domain